MTVLVLAGPTAAGKTEAAIAVAERFDAVIVSADAMQVYRGLDVGTAKASPEERARARHFGIDVREVPEPFDAADFVDLADAVLAAHPRVVVAGGTHLYVRSFLRGLVDAPSVDAALRSRLEALPDKHARLQAVDPELAARLHPNDHVRIVRGLEVFEATGQRLSALHAAHAALPDRVQSVGLWLDRPDLQARIDARLVGMADHGYLDEVRGLLGRYSGDEKPLQSLGYRHLVGHLRGELDLDEALRRTGRDTWEFARKQRNWARVLGLPRVTSGHVDAALAAAERAFQPKPR